jgi:hypothetical protein
LNGNFHLGTFLTASHRFMSDVDLAPTPTSIANVNAANENIPAARALPARIQYRQTLPTTLRRLEAIGYLMNLYRSTGANPQRLKPASSSLLTARLEAVPFPNPFMG